MATVKQQKTKVKIPAGFTVAERRLIARDIIDFIVERTEKSLTIGRKKEFKELSDKYKEKKKAIGGSGKPDLTLTGDMLSAIRLLTSKPTLLEIGFLKGTDENAKASGHITGDIGVKRDFLGIMQKDVNELIRALKRSKLIGKKADPNATKEAADDTFPFDEDEKF